MGQEEADNNLDFGGYKEAEDEIIFSEQSTCMPVVDFQRIC